MTDPDGGHLLATTRTLSDHDRREVVAFKRFLSLGIRPNDAARVRREFPGWLPYVLGWGPPPPEGFDDVPVAAWPVPVHDPPVAWRAGPDYAFGGTIDGVCCPAMPEGSVAIGYFRDAMVVLEAEPGRR